MAFLKTLPYAIGAVVCALTQVASAEAGPRHDRYAKAPVDGYVVAESRFGNGTVSGPVRLGRVGYQVRMPGGTWIECRRSCSETLRVETVDFWENQGRDRIDNECGLFGCLTWSRRF